MELKWKNNMENIARELLRIATELTYSSPSFDKAVSTLEKTAVHIDGIAGMLKDESDSEHDTQMKMVLESMAKAYSVNAESIMRIAEELESSKEEPILSRSILKDAKSILYECQKAFEILVRKARYYFVGKSNSLPIMLAEQAADAVKTAKYALLQKF